MNFLKTYFKTRGLRQIAQWLIIAAVSILSLSFFAVADAYAATTCDGADIAGTATPAFPNTNSLDFGDPPSVLYRAEICPYVSGSEYFELKGWVWDTNLGWISLYCKDGTNAGLACGSYNYGVKIKKSADPLENGKMYGWAWGDNIGWISFGCSGSANDGTACGAINYSGTTSLTVDENLGEMSGYVWADTVGWFNLTGPSALMLPVVVPQSTSESLAGVWTKVENNRQIGEARNEAPNKITAPVADGTQGYGIFINLADFNGNFLNSPDLTISITTSWNDNVQFDQTISATDPGYLDPDNLKEHNVGPTTKAGIDGNKFSFGPIPTGGSVNTLYAPVTSTAPTDLNCYDENKNGSCADAGDFYYKNFGSAVPSQNLEYLGANVTFMLDHGGGVIESLTHVLPPLNYGWLGFIPPFELTTFNYLLDPNDLGSGVNYIESYRNKPDYFNIHLTQRSATTTPNTTLYLTTGSPDVEYGWIADLEAELPGTTTKSFEDGRNIAMPYAPAEEGDEVLAAKIEGAKAYSIIDYVLGGNTIKYYSNGIPRILDSVIINQSAEFLSGQVYSPGAIKVREGDVVTSIGDLATNELRNSLLRNIKRMTGNPPSLGGGKEIFEAGSAYSQYADGYIYYYKDTDVYISDLSWLSGIGHPVTLVVEGDVYIETNINSPAGLGTAPGVDFGIVAFERESYTNEGDRGGRVYIKSNVTDMVNVYIYADHAMFRYTDDICYFINSYGTGLYGQKEPNFVRFGRCSGAAGTFKEPITNLVNQFYFKGTIASENCIGCATKTELYRGDGKLLGSPTPENFAIARLYDLNYFGYFRRKPDGNLSGARSESMKIIEIARGMGLDGMLGPIYFDYAAPPADMAGFSR